MEDITEFPKAGDDSLDLVNNEVKDFLSKQGINIDRVSYDLTTQTIQIWTDKEVPSETKTQAEEIAVCKGLKVVFSIRS